MKVVSAFFQGPNWDFGTHVGCPKDVSHPLKKKNSRDFFDVSILSTRAVVVYGEERSATSGARACVARSWSSVSSRTRALQMRLASAYPQQTVAICISFSVTFGRFQSDLDFEKFNRLARSVALQNTLDRPRPTPCQPLSNANGIINRYTVVGR